MPSKNIKKLLPLIFTSSIIFASSLMNTIFAAPKNIIYMIGDGMGPNYLTAYRYWLAQSPNASINPTIFDTMWRGTAMTYPKDDTFVTDSAAGATALATSHKSYNGAISVDHEHQSLYTLMEAAKAKGKKTGLVVTSEITHATPASFYAHQKSRKDYPQIADQIVDNRINHKPVMDLLLGGGQEDLIREDRNILLELTELGYQSIEDFTQLDKLTQLPAIGVFHPRGFPSAIDSNTQRLATMTKQALALLKNPNGFVLLIEGSQIDWCGHANDIACAMAEMQDFANSLSVVKDFINNNPDTLVVVTADHETGGMSLGANGNYKWLPEVISQVRSSSKTISHALVQVNQSKLNEIQKVWAKHVDFQLDNNELLAFQQILNDETLKQAEQIKKIDSQTKQIINQRSFTGWTSGGHTGLDVPVLAYGQGSILFNGFQNNTQISEKLHSLLK